MNPLPVTIEVHPVALKQMRDQQAGSPRTRWAAYQNQALDSSRMGELMYLAVGPDNTFKLAPRRYPDTALGTGWAYLICGWVNLETGLIETDRCRRCGGDLPRGTYHAEPPAMGYCSVNCEKEDAP